ncbi:MAG: hypothetical protein NC410_09105 [Oscillibacter sp.]|nr:hypothetical protein [Oscillibacter sp.]
MQYILTEEEYKALVPIEKLKEAENKIEILNAKVTKLTNIQCKEEFFCDYCPIGYFGINTCTKKQTYSK